MLGSFGGKGNGGNVGVGGGGGFFLFGGSGGGSLFGSGGGVGLFKGGRGRVGVDLFIIFFVSLGFFLILDVFKFFFIGLLVE